jgi:hypothetical protein
MADDAPEQTQGAPQQQAGKTREQQAREDRDAFLAGIDEELAKKPAPATKPATKPTATESDETDPAEVEDEDELDDEDAEESEDEDADEDELDLDDEDEDGDSDGDGAAKVDADTSKRLDKVRKAERRMREAADAREKQFEREKQEFFASMRPRMEKLERFEALEGKVNSRPIEVLVSLGLKPENFGLAARSLFAETDEGKKDPRNREAVAERASRMELEARIADMQRRLDERDTKETTAAERQLQEQQLDAYFTRVKKAASDEHPLAKHVLAKTPKKAERELTELTYELAKKLGGKYPKPATVMRMYEKQVRRDLGRLGVDVDAMTKAPATATTKAPATATTKGKPNGKPANGSAPDGRKPWQQPTRDEVLAELNLGAADESGLS